MKLLYIDCCITVHGSASRNGSTGGNIFIGLARRTRKPILKHWT